MIPRLPCCLLALAATWPAHAQTEPAARAPVIADAADFLHELPAGDTWGDVRLARGEWVFNNTVLALRTAAPASAEVEITEPGTYRLWVRARGTPAAGIRVAVNGATDAAEFGTGALGLHPGEGRYDLPRGKVRLTLTPTAVGSPATLVDAVVLSPAARLTDDDLRPHEFPGDAVELKSYRIPPAHAVKFGDVDGDGKTDFLVFGPDYSAYVFGHDGRELWREVAPAENTRLRAEFEAPGSVWDFDGDGRAEVIHWRLIDGRETLVMADGATGQIKHRAPWPTTPWPHVYNNFRTAIARLQPGVADNLIVLTDSGGTISLTAYDRELRLVWQHVEKRKKDHLGHYIYPVDLDSDGIDEIVVSHLALDAKGRVLWSNLDTLWPDHHDHADSFRFTDLDGDGQLEALCPQSDVGVAVYRARTGELLWKHPAAHAQQLTFGHVLPATPGTQVLVNARYYGRQPGEPPGLSAQVHWFDARGELLLKWPRTTSLNGNPDFVKGDWRGDGRPEIFWYKFHLTPEGTGTLFFAEEVYHMFDFLRNGAEQVIALNKGEGVLKIYGARTARPRPVTRDPDYWRTVMANHTHY